MRWLYKLPLRLRSLFRKDQTDNDLSAELQFHLHQQTDQYVAQGMAPLEARYAALRDLGGLEQIKEECREMRQVGFLENSWQDIRFAMRIFSRNPGFALIVILTLALGIGVNTAIFTLVNGILLQPLPYADPDRLTNVGEAGPLPMGGFLGFQERIRSMEIAAYGFEGLNLSGDGNALRLNGSSVSSNLFSLLGANVAMGRVFQPGDEVPGKDRLAILSYSLWQTRFGGDANVLGRSITIDDVPRQIIGVMPMNFDFPRSSTQIWIPAALDRQNLWQSFDLYMIGRLRSGVSLDQARAEFKTAAPQVVKTFPWQMGQNYAPLMNVSGMQKDSAALMRTTLLLLLGAVALILLVACINVANLLLARATGRQREMAVRAALGASRRRIVRQLLTESVLLSLVGGAAGVVLAFLSLGLLKALLPQNTPRLAEIRIDGYVLMFSAALSFLTGLLFGLVPAVNASRPELDQVLRTASQSAGVSRLRVRLSFALVVGEVALAVILVSGAGLLIKSLYTLTTEQTGLQVAHLLTAHITPTSAFCKKNNNCEDFYGRVIEEAHSLPGVTNIALSNGVPLYSSDRTVVAAENSTQFTPQNPHSVWEFTIESDYLKTMGIELLRGRTFTDEDQAGSPLVVLVDKSLADLFWPGQDALGKRIKLSWTKDWRTVIGVVQTVSSYKVAPDWYAKTIIGQVYFPANQDLRGHPYEMDLLVRSQGDLRILAQEIPGVVSRVNASVPVTRVRSMDEVIHVTTEEPRSTMWLFTALAALALSLGLIGIYSVMSYTVAQRTREIGIRMAMGAERRDVLAMLLRQGCLLTLIGLTVGLPGSFLLTRLMGSLLYGTRPGDPTTLTAVAALVGLAALAASYIPARRATAIDPTAALKYE